MNWICSLTYALTYFIGIFVGIITAAITWEIARKQEILKTKKIKEQRGRK